MGKRPIKVQIRSLLTDSDKKSIREGRAKYARMASAAKSKPLSAAKYAAAKAKLKLKTKDFMSKMKRDNPSSMLSDKTFGKPPKSGSAKLKP